MRKRQPSAVAAVFAIILTVIFIALAFVATPLLALLVGMVIGYILEFFTGDYIIGALHAIGLTGIQSGDLPKVFGLLSVVAIFLKAFISDPVSRRESDD